MKRALKNIFGKILNFSASSVPGPHDARVELLVPGKNAVWAFAT